MFSFLSGIARWLIERSAVCPLCKLDLYEEEEDDDDDEEEENVENATEMQPLFSRIFQSTSRQWPQGRNVGDAPPQRQEVAETTTAADATTNDPSEARSWWPFSVEIAPAPSRDEHGDVVAPSIWSRWNLFGIRRQRVHMGDALSTEMTEPLIAESTTQQTQILQRQHSMEESTFSPLSPASSDPLGVESIPDAINPPSEPTSDTNTTAEV